MSKGVRRRWRSVVGLVLFALFGVAAWRTAALFRQFQCDQDLIMAVHTTDPNGVRAALASGANPNVRDSGQRPRSPLQQLLSLFRRSSTSGAAAVPGTPVLEYAFRKNYSGPRAGAVMLTLIRAGARLDPAWAHEALLYATSSGHTPVVEEVLNRHLITLWRTEPNLMLQFSLESSAGEDMTRFWLAHGADASARFPGGRTPIMYAARAGQVKKLRVLLDAGTDVNAKDFERNARDHVRRQFPSSRRRPNSAGTRRKDEALQQRRHHNAANGAASERFRDHSADQRGTGSGEAICPLSSRSQITSTVRSPTRRTTTTKADTKPSALGLPNTASWSAEAGS